MGDMDLEKMLEGAGGGKGASKGMPKGGPSMEQLAEMQDMMRKGKKVKADSRSNLAKHILKLSLLSSFEKKLFSHRKASFLFFSDLVVD